MKKLPMALLIFALFFVGCSYHAPEEKPENAKKQSKIELYSAQDNKLLRTIDDQSAINKLLDTGNWETPESIPADLTPEYTMLVYQEKTLLYGQDPDEEREYELIATVITYQNSPYVKETISNTVIPSMTVPEEALTFYYTMPDDIHTALQKLIYETTL